MLIGPSSASLEDFDFRVSMAVVDSDGPFSCFPGIDRQLVVLCGDGLALTVAGQDERLLKQDSAPFAFMGELPITSRRLGSKVKDFNAMTRRGKYGQRLQRIVLAPGESVFGKHDMTLLLPLQVELLYVGEGRREVLAPHDAVLLAPGESIRSAAQAPMDCLLLSLIKIDGLVADRG